MSASGDVSRVLEAVEEHEIPRCTLQRRRLKIACLPWAGGYQVITSFYGTPFRFTALLYQQDTTHLVCFEHEVDGHWTPGRIERYDQPLLREFCCQFLGFISSVIAIEPDVPQLACAAALDDQAQMNFFNQVTAYTARKWHAALTVHRFRDVLGYTITLPQEQTA